MTEPRTPDPSSGFQVVIAGGGVAGLEAAFALRELAGERVACTLISPDEDFTYRPLSVGEPFNHRAIERYPLAAVAGQADTTLVGGSVVHVDADHRVVRLADGAEIRYDALIVATGATFHERYQHVTTVDDRRMDELLHGLVQDVEEGYVRRLAIVVPAPPPWPLPAYELALMASERAWDMQTKMDVVVLTPERAPLEVFGDSVSRALADMFGERRIQLITSAHCEVPHSQTIAVHPGGATVTADRVVALPELRGPRIDGLPCDAGGFLPIDRFGRVTGVESVWAAGDGTDSPIKHGSVAAGMADVVAADIAARLGAQVAVQPHVPVLEAVLMTGGTPLHLRGGPGADGDSVFEPLSEGEQRPKVAAHYLAPRLRSLRAAGSRP